MNKILGISISICVLFSCSIIKKISNNSKLDFKSYIESKYMNKKKKGTLVAKIDNIPITLQQVVDEMEYNLSYDYSETQVSKLKGDPSIKKNYENKIVNQYLIIKKMLEDKDFESEDFKKYIDISLKEIFVKYFMYKNFFKKEENKKWKELIITTDSEVLNFYNENKNFFDERQVNKEDALYAIRTDLENRKNSLFMSELLKFQNSMIDQLKTEYKVERIEH